MYYRQHKHQKQWYFQTELKLQGLLSISIDTRRPKVHTSPKTFGHIAYPVTLCPFFMLICFENACLRVSPPAPATQNTFIVSTSLH